MSLDTTEKSGPIENITGAHNVEAGTQKEPLDVVHIDIGWDLYQQALLLDPADRDAIAKRVKRKLDLILLPMVRDRVSPSKQSIR